jgi:pimeloyl-ACP methyl ester carboxylesterase
MTMKAERQIVAPGVEYAYYHRKGGKPTLVFIHGLGDWKETHLPSTEYSELADYGILFIDQIGYGDSSNPEHFNYTMKEQAEMLLKLIDKLDINEVVLVPHSMGGPVAVDLAEMMGSRVKGIVYAEGNVDFNDCFFSNWIITKNTYDEWVGGVFQGILERYKADPEQANYVTSFGKAGPVSTYRSSEDLVAVSKKDDIRDRLAALKIPVLAVFGEKNKGKFTSEAKMADKFPLVFIPGAEHSMMVDNPNAYYSEIARLVKSI